MGPQVTEQRELEDTVSRRKNFESFLWQTEDSRASSERCRDYRDLKQWTADEVATLESRGQKAIVVPRVPAKIEHLLGMERNNRTDPKAYPRTPKHEQASEAVTDALRYVADDNDFQNISSDCFEYLAVEGTEAAVVEIEETKRGIDVVIRPVDWDRFYYDPYSRKKDFSDAAFLGIVIWMDESDAKARFKESADLISGLLDNELGDTYEDKPVWIDFDRKRVRICEEYYLKDGVWHVCYYSGDHVLVEPQPSPYVDEFGDPVCPIIAQSAMITRDNDRYGPVKAMLDLQDEINHRRSKALYMLSSRTVVAERGAVDDPAQAQRELRKAQGFVEINPNFRFDIQPNGDIGSSQFQLLQEAKMELDALGGGAALAGKESRDLSGRAIQAMQAGGSMENAALFDAHRFWKRRIYKAIWHRIRQFWTEEKWVRVTDNEDSMKWVGLNIPVTAIEQIISQQTGTPIEKVAEQFQQEMAQAVQTDPTLGEVVATRNDVAELDMDIILEESPDTVNIQQEQVEMLVQLAQMWGPEVIPPKVILQSMQLRNKRQLLEALEPDPQQVQAQQQEQQQLKGMAMAKQQAEIEETQASAQVKQAQAAKYQTEAKAGQIDTAIGLQQASMPQYQY